MRRGAGIVRHEVNEAKRAKMAPLLPGKVSDPGRSGQGRLFVSGCLWVRSGARRLHLPERHGKWSRCTAASIAHAMRRSESGRSRLTTERNNQYLMLYSAIIRPFARLLTTLRIAETFLAGSVNQHARAEMGQDQALGLGATALPRRLTTRIHMLADARGLALKLVITAGEVGDITQAPALLHGQGGSSVLADKAHGSNASRTAIAGMDGETVSSRTAAARLPSRTYGGHATTAGFQIVFAWQGSRCAHDASPAAASVRIAAFRWGMSYILPPIPSVPASGFAAKASMMVRASAISSGDGEKAALIVGT